MFTGLIHTIGIVNRRGEGLAVEGCEPFAPLKLGESVAVDGICLTVTGLLGSGFLADVSEETLSRTTLGMKAQRGDFVNLEPALRLSDRLDGHLVSGHIDGLGKVVSIEELSNSWRLEVTWNDFDYGRYICEKGSIAIDGISLTVGGCSEKGSRFWIAIIPQTWQSTSLKYLSVGSLVNLEADLMAKYAESLLRSLNVIPSGSEMNNLSSEVSKEWLAKHGWT